MKNTFVYQQWNKWTQLSRMYRQPTKQSFNLFAFPQFSMSCLIDGDHKVLLLFIKSFITAAVSLLGNIIMHKAVITRCKCPKYYKYVTRTLGNDTFLYVTNRNIYSQNCYKIKRIIISVQFTSRKTQAKYERCRQSSMNDFDCTYLNR
jgi:hypothetical protein